MIRRIAALSCCLSLVQVSIAAADDTTASRPSPLTLAVVNDAHQSGPIRKASLNNETVTTYIGETRSATRSLQDRDTDTGSWVERHPVWTGAMVGFATGFALTYVATHDSNEGEFLKVMSTSAGATFWGGVCAGVGALAGWAIGRNRDDD
jgi:hypothetical protein